MARKWTTLAVAVTALCLTATGLSYADEDSPLHKLMEKVSAKNNAITKGTRTVAAYKKAQKDLASLADELVKLGKEARPIKDAADKQKKPVSEWTKLMDDFIQKSELLKTSLDKSTTTQQQAKTAHTAVKAACTNCHNVFRVDDTDTNK
jgi:cytochrome c556